MAVSIRDVLNRRTDLSTFVVHLTKDGVDQDTARARLESILEERTIHARMPMGWASDQDEDEEKQSQRVVSFTETPLEHIYSHVADILGRSVVFQPYGIAMTKLTARSLGINPIWYVDKTPGQRAQWEVARAIDALKADAIASGDFHAHHAAKLLPFFEQMGTWTGAGGTQKEFWWEREWRSRGDVHFDPLVDGCLILCPEEDLDHFETLVVPGLDEGERRRRRRHCIDPRWGLEQIVAHLAGIPQSRTTPFAP